MDKYWVNPWQGIYGIAMDAKSTAKQTPENRKYEAKYFNSYAEVLKIFSMIVLENYCGIAGCDASLTPRQAGITNIPSRVSCIVRVASAFSSVLSSCISIFWQS